ncbi:Uncharacterised protein [Mycobacteroides abscessus subsp. abscessus]|nr:Uncharacterised protein [Mycobacteroides abscessus subsp. abscessus]
MFRAAVQLRSGLRWQPELHAHPHSAHLFRPFHTCLSELLRMDFPGIFR